MIPSASSFDRHAQLYRRSHTISAIRTYFARLGFLEVDTPVSIVAPAPEPYIDAIAHSVTTRAGIQSRYLQTSPELAMKQLVARGFGSIYQLAPCFRDNDDTAWHRPEFRLLEWYRPTDSYLDLIDDAMNLLRHLALARGQGATLERLAGKILLDAAPHIWTLHELFERFAKVSLGDCTSTSDLHMQASRVGVRTNAKDSYSDVFNRLFLHFVEPHLALCDRPVFLIEFPAPLAALAKLVGRRPHVAERVEMYVGGIELANGFGELTDVREQRRRFIEDNASRKAMGKSPYPLDEDFLAAVGNMPPTAGMALGFERLLMLLENAKDIDEVNFLPW